MSDDNRDSKEAVQLDNTDNSPANIKAIQKHNAKIHKFIDSMLVKIEEKKTEFIAEPTPKTLTLAECNAMAKKAKIADKVAPEMSLQQVKIKPVVPQFNAEA
jgi:hypothetical protein